MNVIPSSQALVPTKGLPPAQRRQRTRSVAVPAIVLVSPRYRTPAGTHPRVPGIDAQYSDFIPARRETQANAQLALYEFIQDDKAGFRKGAFLDVFV